MTKRILVAGCGFAGMWSCLSAARLLDQQGREDVEITIIAPAQELQVRPRFYEADVARMKAPLEDVFKAAGVQFIQGIVERIDVERQEVAIHDAAQKQSTVSYDRLVLATGSRLHRPDIPGLIDHAFSVDQLDEAVSLETHIEKLATLPESPARDTIVVVGGGFTGIETAAEMPSRLRKALGQEADVQVILLDQNKVPAAALGEGPRPIITQALDELGVRWYLGASVASIDGDGLNTFDGQRIEAKTVIWTAGLRANALTEQIPAQRDASGRLHVDQNLRVKGLNHVYATGDVAYAATDDDGNYTMMSCQHAMNLGRSAGHNAMADLLGVEPSPYSQPKYVTCLDLGPWGAVYTEGWDREVKLEGPDAKDLKQKINTEWIYPPSAERQEVLAAADPNRVVAA